MRLQEIDKDNYQLYINEIVDLYINSFGKGESAQYLEKVEVINYIQSLFLNGSNAILSFDKSKITGVLVFCPFTLDKDIPESLRKKHTIEKCIYVAELMVDVSYRGLGIAKKLVNEFIITNTLSLYNDAFIRVWDKNKIAIGLYKNVGFTEVESIIQSKKSVDGKEIIDMNKIYLWRRLK